MREEVIADNPGEAHAALLAYRRKRAEVSAETISIQGHKHRSAISEAKQPFLEAIARIPISHQDCWPLSVRQIHYCLLNDPPLKHASKSDSTYQNTLKDYKLKLSMYA